MPCPLPYRFDDTQRHITITDPRLPQPWINYLSNGTLHAFVSQAGGGFSWWKSPLKNRLTRYRQYNLPIDSPGFYVYLKGADGIVWSPTWRPVETPLDAWRAEHRPGLTRFVARKGSVEATLDLFIAPGENVVVWDLQLKNLGDQPIALDVTGYVEFCLLDWKQDTDWACYVKHNLQTALDKEANAVTYLYRHFHFNPQLADCPLVYFGASEPAASFDGERDAFMGNYRDERNPVAVERGACSNSEMLCGDPCGALQCRIEVPVGGSKRMQFFLGGEPKTIVEWPHAILSETGDLSLLDESIPWLSAEENLSPVGSATIWMHLLRIPDFMEANLGSHWIQQCHRFARLTKSPADFVRDQKQDPRHGPKHGLPAESTGRRPLDRSPCPQTRRIPISDRHTQRLERTHKMGRLALCKTHRRSVSPPGRRVGIHG